MELIADILLVAGALGAGLYCFVLARRLKRFTDLEKGVGGAVAVLSAQADELKASLGSARAASDQSGEELRALTQRAEAVAQRLELMMASMHDVIPEKEKPADEAQEPVEPTESEPDLPEPAPSSTEDDSTEVNETSEPKNSLQTAEGVMFLRHARPLREAAK
ncbi:MAG: hypothetical protein AB3N19_11435 [Ruegeria sp.]